MKKILLFLTTGLLISSAAIAQGSFNILIDGSPYPFKKVKAGAEKIMGNPLVGITFSDEQRSCALDFEYAKIAGKKKITLSSEMDKNTYSKGFNFSYKPQLSTMANWVTGGIPAGTLEIDDYNEIKKTISGHFDVTLVQLMDDKGTMTMGQGGKTIRVKGEFKDLPFTKID